MEHYEFKDAFPMVMIEHKHEWKIKARLPETDDVSERNYFELFINDKSFQEHEFIDLAQENSNTL